MDTKRYYKIEFRMSDYDSEETIYYSDGFAIVEKNVFEGYLTDDYIIGIAQKNMLFLEMLYTHQGFFDTDALETEYRAFNVELEDEFYLPENYCLKSSLKDGCFAEISFVSTVKNEQLKKNIETELIAVKKENYM